MARFGRFTFLVDKQERQLIAALAERLQRSQSDAVRFLIRNSDRVISMPPLEMSICEFPVRKDEIQESGR